MKFNSEVDLCRDSTCCQQLIMQFSFPPFNGCNREANVLMCTYWSHT